MLLRNDIWSDWFGKQLRLKFLQVLDARGGAWVSTWSIGRSRRLKDSKMTDMKTGQIMAEAIGHAISLCCGRQEKVVRGALICVSETRLALA